MRARQGRQPVGPRFSMIDNRLSSLKEYRMRHPKVRALSCLLLLMLLSQPFGFSTTSAAPQTAPESGPSHRVLINSGDTATLQLAARNNNELLADYGSF